MKSPAWAVKMHRQWMVARGGQTPRIKNFHRNWERLLAASDIVSAVDRKVAVGEAEEAERLGRVKLLRQRNRKAIQRIELLPEGERWLCALTNQRSPDELRQQSLAAVHAATAREHPRLPELWAKWCEDLAGKCNAGKSARPFLWKSPEDVQTLLDWVYRLTSYDWSEGALVREASTRMGLENSKQLERHHLAVEACLGQLFGRRTTLESLGIELTDSRVDISGVLTLHFDNGEPQVINELEDRYMLSLHDLERARRATTTAVRLLTVENSKTTFRRLVSENARGDTLFVASSFPTRALLRLLALLPADNFPVYHFGDTDPTGFLILSKLREGTRRPIIPFLMEWRPWSEKRPLSSRDREILPGLLTNRFLADVRAQVEQFTKTGCKGDYEQENLGLPNLPRWPFYSRAEALGGGG